MIKIVMLTRQDGDEILWWAIWMQTFNWIYPSWETDEKLDMQQRATETMCSTVHGTQNTDGILQLEDQMNTKFQIFYMMYVRVKKCKKKGHDVCISW